MKEFNNIYVGMKTHLCEIWDGEENILDVFENKNCYIGNDENDMPMVAEFEIIEANPDDLLRSWIKITDIY